MSEITDNTQLNSLKTVHYKRGWPGLFAGENQDKAMLRALEQVNAEGRKIAAVSPDRWSFFKRLGCALLALVTLGFVVKAPNLILVTEPA